MGAGSQRWWKDDATPEIRWARYLADTEAWTQEQTLELARAIAQTYPDCAPFVWSWAVAVQVIDSIQFHEQRLFVDDHDDDDLLAGLPVLHPMRRGAGLLPIPRRAESQVITFTEDASGLARAAREQGGSFLRRFGADAGEMS